MKHLVQDIQKLEPKTGHADKFVAPVSLTLISVPIGLMFTAIKLEYGYRAGIKGRFRKGPFDCLLYTSPSPRD